MKFIALFLCLLFSGLSLFAKEASKKIYKVGAEAMTYGSVEDHNFKIKQPNVDFEFPLFGANIQLRGFTDERSKPFYYQELEQNFNEEI